MKPYISEILEHNGKTYTLPVPAKYRELMECVSVLGIKDKADEDDVRHIGYKALYVPEPDTYDSDTYIEEVAAELSKLNEDQVKALGGLCDAFALPFGDIMGILAYIYPHLKEAGENEN